MKQRSHVQIRETSVVSGQLLTADEQSNLVGLSQLLQEMQQLADLEA